jgi:hypothetical protein
MDGIVLLAAIGAFTSEISTESFAAPADAGIAIHFILFFF